MFPRSALLLLTLAASGAKPPEVVEQTSASTIAHDDEGTTLTATAAASAPACGADGTAQVALSGTVTSTGSVDSVEITATIDGGAAISVGTLEPADFRGDGRDKTADYSISLSLDSGSHEIVLCFTQSGAQGRDPKQYCTAPITVVVACDDCSQQAPFGDIVGNPDLCNGAAPPHVPIHLRGGFGDAATLVIDGPDGYHLAASLEHAGRSCIYQYNWDTAGNGGAGTYTFSVTGSNDAYLSFTAELLCR